MNVSHVNLSFNVIGLSDVNGYRAYEIKIPPSLFSQVLSVMKCMKAMKAPAMKAIKKSKAPAVKPRKVTRKVKGNPAFEGARRLRKMPAPHAILNSESFLRIS